MTDPVELFSALAGQFEDLHGLAVEAQREDQPSEMLLILSAQISTRVQICREVVGRINDALEPS